MLSDPALRYHFDRTWDEQIRKEAQERKWAANQRKLHEQRAKHMEKLRAAEAAMARVDSIFPARGGRDAGFAASLRPDGPSSQASARPHRPRGSSAAAVRPVASRVSSARSGRGGGTPGTNRRVAATATAATAAAAARDRKTSGGGSGLGKSIYAGVTGIDLAPAPPTAPTAPAGDQACFTTPGSSCYHLHHDCRKLRAATSVTSSTESRFLLERKSLCTVCRDAGKAYFGVSSDATMTDTDVTEWLRQAGPSVV